jgi:hypothetical protein
MNNSSQFIGLRRKLLSGVRGNGDPTSVNSETAVDMMISFPIATTEETPAAAQRRNENT